MAQAVNEKKRFLTESEIESFLKASRLTRNGVRDFCLALMSLRHGLRVSELIDIRLSEVDLSSGHLYVRRRKGSLSTGQPMEGDEMRAVRAWMRERSAHVMAGSDYLFLSERGAFTRQAINYLFAEIGKKAALPMKVHPHMLRHSCGYELANRGRTTRDIQDYLGHKNIKHTVIYTATNAARFKGIWRK